MTYPNVRGSTPSDLQRLRDAAHLQQGTITTQSKILIDRWDLEDLVAAGARVADVAEKYECVAPILGRLLPLLEDICFADIAVTEDIAALRELSETTSQSDQQPTL